MGFFQKKSSFCRCFLSNFWTVGRAVNIFLAWAIATALGASIHYSHKFDNSAKRGPATAEATLTSFIANPPAKYAALDIQLQETLGRSVLDHALLSPDSSDFHGATLWEFLDASVAPSLLQTLVQIHKGATQTGLWSTIERIRKVYAGTSWGIEFTGPKVNLETRTRENDFCHDLDVIVRRDHGNTRHRWWRNFGVFDKIGSLHLGVADGETYHNLHFDTTNPAVSRGFLGDKELCRYTPLSVVEHNIDIRYSSNSGAVRGFLIIENIFYLHWRASKVIHHDLDFAPPQAVEPWQAIVRKFDDLEGLKTAIYEKSMLVASLPDGSVRIRDMVFPLLREYEVQLISALAALAEQTRIEGFRSGHFDAAFAPIERRVWEQLENPFKTRITSPGTADFETLFFFQEALRKGSLHFFDPHQMDDALGVYDRIRAKIIGAFAK